jgi:hypothetical protein
MEDYVPQVGIGELGVEEVKRGVAGVHHEGLNTHVSNGNGPRGGTGTS